MGVYCAASMTFGRPELAPQVRLDQTAPMNAVDFASLLCSRLCHDLMSPVGALNNGIELMADEQDPEMRERCVELLADSDRATANKLSKGAMKLLLNLALIAGDALVRGGRLDVGAETTGAGLEIAIRGEGPKVVLDAGLREMLINGAAPDAQIEPRAAGAWLASALAKESGGSIRLSEPEPEVLIIGAVVPRN